MKFPNADQGGDMNEDLPVTDASGDNRFSNGIPDNLHISELDFIQMTGLTRPVSSSAEAASSDPSPASMPAPESAAINFFERGVLDVEHTMTDTGMELGSTETPDEVLGGAASSADKLKEIIDALQHAMDSNGSEQPSDIAWSEEDEQQLSALTLPEEEETESAPPPVSATSSSPDSTDTGSSPFLAVPEEPQEDTNPPK